MKLRSRVAERVRALRRISNRDLLLLLAALPILLLFAVAPQTFELSWAGFGKLGRGGLFFVLFFLAFDLLDLSKGTRIKWTAARKVATVGTVAAAIVYFVEVGSGQDLTNMIYAVGRTLGASGNVSNSFLMATDFLAATLYLIALTAVTFGIRIIRSVITPIVFSLGMFIFYLLDAFLPYGSIGPLQFWANFIVSGVAALAKIFELPIYGLTNHLTIVGIHGTYRLVVYWPSVGVQSILIYSVVMIVIAAKLQAPRMRKIAYAIIGVIGTVFLNVVRIFSIAYYGYAYATSGDQLDAFHNAIGEVLFPIWIVVFLAVILKVEDRLTLSSNATNRKRRSS